MTFFYKIKRFFFRIVWISTLIFLAFWAFISYTKAPAKNYLVIHSKLRSNITLLKPHEWYFFPEKLIPRQITIEKIPQESSLTGTKEVLLPYHQLLSSFGNFRIIYRYQSVLRFQESELAQFEIGEFDRALKAQKEKIESLIEKVSEDTTAQVPFTKDILIDKISKELENNQIEGYISISESSDLDLYQSLRQDIQAYDKLQKMNLREQKVKSAIENQKAELEIKLKKDKIDTYLDTVIEMSKKIQESKADPQLVLDMLKFLMNNDQKKETP